MKTRTPKPTFCTLALVAIIGGLVIPAEAQKTPTSAVACNFVGRFYLNPVSLQGEVVGYFTNIHGIANGMSAPLFSGSPSERTAFFTFRSDVFALNPLPANGDLVLFLVSAGKFNVFFNPAPNSDWTNLDTFSNGQHIANFTRPEVLDLQFESTSQHMITETLISSQSFTFNGYKYNFSELVPGGITLFEAISNTALPALASYSIVLPFAGSGIAVACEKEQQH
jgi:hypothetical protein